MIFGQSIIDEAINERRIDVAEFASLWINDQHKPDIVFNKCFQRTA